MLLEIASNYVFAPSIANIAIKVNGANYLTVSSTSTNNNLAMYNVTLPIGDKYIEIINGEQSLASLTPPVQGTWVRSVYVPSSSYLTYNNSLKSQKLLIYGDSIAGGGAIVSPPLNAWTSLFRNNTNLDLTVYAYGWRNLQYDVANVGISTMTNNILKVSPNIIYLAIGTNDYGLNRQSANNFGIQYGQLIDSVHSSLPNATIYAQTPLNRSTETANTFGNTLQDYRDQIISVVVSRSYVKLVNGTQILSTSDMDDGLHPNFAGNIKYFNYVNSLINDNYYPIFSNYTDNNEALKGSGLGTFNVNLLNSNGTVWLNINGTNITAINQSMLFFANYSFTQAGVYSYRWYAYGNGSSNLLNQSEIFNYTVQESTSNSTNLPNGGSGGWYLNKFNETIMCDFTYSFLVDKIAKTGGRNYSNEELNNLTAMINVQMRVKTDNSTAKLYLDNFEKKCGNKLPKKRAETNGTKLIDYTSGISPCTPDINSTFTLLNAKFNMDSNIPFFNIEIGRANCVSIESLRWLFKIEKAQDRYTISGIKLWWVLVLSVILVISLIYRHSRKSQRPQMPRHRR
jgi:lysophospholipase L1-like esterase